MLKKNLPYIKIGAIVVIILLALTAYVYRDKLDPRGPALVKDSGEGISDYSAVFLANGQVYFGKMYRSNNPDTLDLRNIYYLQVNQDLQKTETDTSDTSKEPDVVLVKLGEELHGPNDRMTINKDQVLFTESLKDDSKVVDAIKNYKK